MRVLVTGIDGFVGSHTAEFLLQQPGVELHGTVLGSNLLENIRHIRSSIHLHQLDILDGRAVQALVAGIRPERVIHLAAQAFVPASIQYPTSTFRVNILGGICVLEAARSVTQDGGGPAIVMVSSGEVYGKVDMEGLPITEDCSLQPNNPYAASKASIDLIAQQYRRSFAMNVIVTRPFNHAGPRQSPVFVSSDFAKQFAEIAAGKRTPTMHVGNIEAGRDFTDVRDVVRAYWLLLEHPADEAVFNVCSGHSVQIRELIETLCQVSGINVEVEVDQQRLRSHDAPVVVGSYDRLHKTTGWTPRIPIQQTLREMYEYWKEQI